MAGRTPASCATMPMRYHAYVDRVMLHEFGHTFGLHDFYDDPTMDHLDAVMNDPYTNKTPTAEDIAQLRAMYALHDSSPHSR